MPIKPENRHFYGKEWREVVRPRIMARALVPASSDDLHLTDNDTVARCECRGECRRSHGPDVRCSEVNGRPATSFRGPVVLTVAHLDQNPGHNSDENLRALCQRCHNRVDTPARAAHAERTRRYKRHHALIRSGQLFMFGLERWHLTAVDEAGSSGPFSSSGAAGE